MASRPADSGTEQLAPPRSEHVDCAAGQQVLAAGEMLFVREEAGWSVGEKSNRRSAGVLEYQLGLNSPAVKHPVSGCTLMPGGDVVLPAGRDASIM